LATTWIALLSLASARPGHGQSLTFSREAACQTLQSASTGGPLPKDPNVLVLRYFSYGNYEIAYRGKVYLLDAFYDNSRSPLAEPTGVRESDITRADAIFVGHTHLDHYADAPAIAERTGAPVFLAPPGLKYVQTHGLADKQINIVRGGETFKLKGVTVQTALGIHMVNPPDAHTAYTDFVTKSSTLTDDQKKQYDTWYNNLVQGSVGAQDYLDPDKDTIYHGTIVYVLTFDGGFRLVYSDSDGVLSGGERALADSIHAGGGKIDVAILGYLDGGYSVRRGIRTTLTRAKVWDPSILFPSHHHDGDLVYPSPMPEMPTAPLFEALRDQLPNVRGVSPLYRSPICINTKTDELFVGNYVH
jgi:hypothetical protein